MIARFKLGLTNMNPIRVEARELPQPSAHFSSGTRELGRGSWNQEPFHQPVSRPLRCVVVTMVPGHVRSHAVRLLHLIAVLDSTSKVDARRELRIKLGMMVEGEGSGRPGVSFSFMRCQL